MLSCREISRLVSESLERPLPWRRRVEVWLHLRMCGLCNAFRINLLRLRDAARCIGEAEEDSRPDLSHGLSSESKDRMRRILLDEQSKDGSGR